MRNPTTAAAVNRFSRYGPVDRNIHGVYCAKVNGHLITWIDQGGFAHALGVCKEGDLENISYARTLKAALRYTTII